ncbi:MAG: ABC transporter substrate-binding protein [Candidatus Binatia bacterium]
MKRFFISFVVAVVLLGLVGAIPTYSLAQTRIKLTQPVDSLTFFPIYVGRRLGYFKDEGIDLEVIATAGGGPHLQAVIAGQAQFTASPGTYQLNALRRGKQVIGIFNILKRNIIGVVINKDVAKKIGVTEKTPFKKKLKKIKGLTLGVTRPGALTYILAEDLIRRAGYVPNKDVRILAVGGGATIVPALKTKKVDMMFISTPHPERAIAGGFGQWFINNAEGEDPTMPEFMMSALMVSPDYAKKNPDIVAKMVRAMRRSVKYITAHRLEDSVTAVTPFFGKKVSSDVLREAVRTVKATVATDGRMSQRAVNITVNIMKKGGKLKRSYRLPEVFTDKYLK